MDQCQIGGVPFVASFKADLDISNLEQLKIKAEKANCTHLINCAAFTNVDEAERNPKRAFTANADGAENIGVIGREMGMHVVHVSTDYVFDGQKGAPYVETDVPSPINVYGKSKLEGEERLFEQFPTACIVRTSWVFGLGGNNFLSSIPNLLQKHSHLDVISDQISKATYSRDLARALIDLSFHSGIFHFANREEGSRFSMVKNCLNQLKERKIPLKCSSIAPISSEVFPSVAQRPLYSALACEKVERVLGKKPRMWETVLNEYLDLLYPAV